MFSAYFKAIAQLSDPAVRRSVWAGLGGAIVLLGVLAAGMWYVVYQVTLFEQWWLGWLDWVVDTLGGVAVMGLTWLLFPAVVSAIIGFLLEGVATAVEARHYRSLEKAEGLPILESVLTALKFLGAIVVLNLLVLPLYLIPVINLFVFYALNGYLLGREYFELVALRRLSPQDVWLLRKVNGFRVFMAGVVLAFLLTVPVVNLLAPIIGTAAMVHLFQAWRTDKTPVKAAQQETA